MYARARRRNCCGSSSRRGVDARRLDVYDICPAIHIKSAMRTNIDIDDALLTEATRLSGLPTKKAVVEEALRRLVRQKGQAEALRELTGIGWDGDLEAMRTDRSGRGPWGRPDDDASEAP